MVSLAHRCSASQSPWLLKSHRRQRVAVRACAHKQLLAIDVEYIHFTQPGGQDYKELLVEQTAPAWVAVVDEDGSVVLNSFCRADLPAGAVRVGGVPIMQTASAPTVESVAEQARQLAAGAVLIGHGLTKDLKSLGLEPPLGFATYDTMQFPGFHNKSGSALTLNRLAQQHLGQVLHTRGRRHDPVVDARAVMQLYKKLVAPKLLTDYDDLVAFYTQQMLRDMGGPGG